MKVCQRCGSNRIFESSSKSCDANGCSFRGEQYYGYFPSDIGLGSCDYVELVVCLECGQVQGEWPAPDPDFEG